MLYYTFDSPARHSRHTFGWHIGERIPNVLPVQNVVRIQADGDELEYILGLNPPPGSGSHRVQTWEGENAQLIFAILQGEK